MAVSDDDLGDARLLQPRNGRVDVVGQALADNRVVRTGGVIVSSFDRSGYAFHVIQQINLLAVSCMRRN